MISAEQPLSPTLAATDGLVAREIKFVVDLELAQEIERRLRDRLTVDSHGSRADGGGYWVSTLHLDTPTFDAYRRTGGEIDAKHRIRRYGVESIVHFERKVKANGAASKRRTAVAMDRIVAELADVRPTAPAGWFARLACDLDLRPIALTHYHRLAFVGSAEHGPLRATVDRRLRGVARQDYRFEPPCANAPSFVAGAVVEFKHHGELPEFFRALTTELGLVSTTYSKYRRFVSWAGLAPMEPTRAA